MAQLSSNKCSICEENTAKLFCYECKHFLCDVCRKSHEKFFPATRRHTVVGAGTVDKSVLTTNLLCEKHNLEFIHFCESCQCLTCSSCDTTDHRSHLLKDIADVAESARETLRMYVKFLNLKENEIEEVIGETKSVRMKRNDDEHKRFREKCNNLSEFFLNVITMVRDTNLNRASNVCILEKEHMNNSISQLEIVKRSNDVVRTEIEQALRETHDVTFYIQQKSLGKKFKELKEIPQIEEPKQLEKLNKEEFILSILDKIQEKYDIRILALKKGKKKRTEQKIDKRQGSKDDDIQQIVDAELRNVRGIRRNMLSVTGIPVGVLAVVAINMGTNSGLSMSFRNDYKVDPMKIRSKTTWRTESKTKISNFLPTCILLGKSKEFVAFGFEAQNKYAELVEDNNHLDYYFITELISQMRYTKVFSSDSMIKDTEGRELPWQHVYSMAIKYLAESYLEESRTRGVVLSDIHWVITIPVTIQDNQTHCFEEAAKKAGLRQFHLCLEPAAAYIYCRYDQERKQSGMHQVSKCMLVDFRDIDDDDDAVITCMERKDATTLEELLSVRVDSVGYSTIQNAFYRFIIGVVGKTVFQVFQQEYKDAALELEIELKSKINHLSVDQSGQITIRIPISLKEMWTNTTDEKPADVLKRMYNQKVSLASDKLKIDSDLFSTFFNEALSRLTRFMEKLFSIAQFSDISTILIIGSLAKCDTIQSAIKKAFPDRKIIIPENPDLVVTQGAVLVGHGVFQCR